jgi:hypothetical protein
MMMWGLHSGPATSFRGAAVGLSSRADNEDLPDGSFIQARLLLTLGHERARIAFTS